MIETDLSKWNKRLRIYPFDARNYICRGMTYFKLGKLTESLRDYNKAEELNPQLTPYLWQRGITYYYLGKYIQGARQFEVDLSVNSRDIEETIWLYLCIAKAEGAGEAQKSLLSVKYDPRPILRHIYELFAQNCTVDDLLKAGKNGDQKDFVYSHFYAGLYLQCQGVEYHNEGHLYIDEAIKEPIADYIWYVAQVDKLFRV